MCGVAGIIGKKSLAREQAVGSMVARQRHRGPNDCGLECIDLGEEECLLGSTRLSIIDLSGAGHMPMRDPSTGNCIVYNGEVYNFAQLRAELQREGERFSSRTDTEVVLRGYARFGASILERLRGMFALALWDASARELFLARDRAGEKPLYYSELPDAFVFASELRSLLASGLFSPRLDAAAVDLFLANGFVVAPHTMVRGVRSLLPGHWIRVNAAGRVVEMGRYWRPFPRGFPSRQKLGDRLHETRRVLEEAVAQRTVSDVPLGVFLSGGLDSSAIAALLARAGHDVHTFSIAFPQSDLDESRYSSLVATSLGTTHTEVKIDESTFWNWIPGALRSMDQPTFEGVNSYCVSRAAKEGGLTVALSGIGSDEMFGGYQFFRTAARVRGAAAVMSRTPQMLRRRLSRTVHGGRSLDRVAGSWKLMELAGRGEYALEDLTDRDIASYQVAQLLFPTWARDSLISSDALVDVNSDVVRRLGLPRKYVEFLREDVATAGSGNSVSILAWRLFLGERCLRDTDAMSMGVSLEVRAPFVDHELVEHLLAIPSQARCAGAPDKPFAWTLFDPYLRGALPKREKQGFIFPFREWLRSESGTEFFAGSLAHDSLADLGLNTPAVRFVFNQFRSDPDRVPWSRAWALAVLMEWCRRYRVTL